MGFLIAAYIKKRPICSDNERRDLSHVAMLACTLGCDAVTPPKRTSHSIVLPSSATAHDAYPERVNGARIYSLARRQAKWSSQAKA